MDPPCVGLYFLLYTLSGSGKYQRSLLGESVYATDKPVVTGAYVGPVAKQESRATRTHVCSCVRQRRTFVSLDSRNRSLVGGKVDNGVVGPLAAGRPAGVSNRLGGTRSASTRNR